MLVFIGGPPGVGKSTVLRRLEQRLERCACLDADDVLRIRPFDLDGLRPVAERNVTSVLRGYLEGGFPIVVLAWVPANPELVQRLLDALEGAYERRLQIYLTASPEALGARAAKDPDRHATPDYVLLKLRQIEALPHPRIDTTHLAPEEVADRIVSEIRAAAGEPARRTVP